MRVFFTAIIRCVQTFYHPVAVGLNAVTEHSLAKPLVGASLNLSHESMERAVEV
jgi:hypothetical protein